jgi:hypothetical protein
MERQLLIQILGEALDDPFGSYGTALIRMLERYEWDWVTKAVDGQDVIYIIQDNEPNTRYCRDDDNARQLWSQFTARMQLEFELYVAKQNRKRSVVGAARIIPFPDSRRPTPAA